MAQVDRRERNLEYALFLVPFLTFAYFYQGADQSAAARFDLMRAIVERGTLWIDGYCGFNTADIVRLGDHYYSVKAPGASFSGLLQWIAFSAILSPLALRHEALYWGLATWLTIIYSTSAMVALTCVVMYRFARFAGATRERGAALALVLAFATIIFPYATEMTGEPMAGACSFIGYYLLATHRRDTDYGRAMVTGVLCGWAVLCDFPALLIAAPLAIYAVSRYRDVRQTAALAIGASAVAVILIAYNRAAFCHPWFFSYEAYKLPGNSQFPEQASGFVGLTRPRLDIVWNILCGSQRGLFYCNPVLLLVLPGFGFFAHVRAMRAELVVTASVIVLMILFNASYGESIVSWGGGTATGPRQIVAIIPFMVFALTFIPAEWNLLFGGLAVVSAFLMLMATAVEPHFPYEYSDPLIDFIWPAYLRGDFAYNRDSYFGGGAIMTESTAYNLGGLLGLPPLFQLWPLAMLWIAGAIVIIRSLDFLAGALSFRIAAMAGAVGIVVAMVSPAAVCAIFCPPKTAGAHGLLGHYYRGLPPFRFPPHIVRADQQIDFDNVAALGALPSPSFVSWTGRLIVPRRGEYLFSIAVDDSGWLRIDGKSVISDPGNQTWREGSGRIFLVPGAHRIEVGQRNLYGDAAMHLYWQPPNHPRELIPSAALIPDHPDD